MGGIVFDLMQDRIWPNLGQRYGSTNVYRTPLGKGVKAEVDSLLGGRIENHVPVRHGDVVRARSNTLELSPAAVTDHAIGYNALTHSQANP